MFVNQFGAAFVLISLTLWFQSVGIGVLVVCERHAVERENTSTGVFRSAVLIVSLTTMAIALHGLEILLWASFYRWLCFPSWNSAFYFSAGSYSTLGCADVVLPLQWRMLGPLESIIGVLMCGVSVSLLYAILTQLISREARLSRK